MRKTLYLTTGATQHTFHRTPHSHTVTYIVSRHLATRGNNKILCTPPPHISRSEEILYCPIRRTLAQLRTNKSPFLKSYLHKVDRQITSITTMHPM